MVVKMCWMKALSMCIYIIHIMGKVNYSEEDKSFAFVGCNTTLEWILWNGTNIVSAKVWNPRGIKIAWVDDGYCQQRNDSPLYCYMRGHGEVGMLYMVLINATEANSGGYTAEIRYGLEERKNITKELVVIDKPKITKPDKTILFEPLNISCAVSGKLDGMSYRWKLNGTDFNSSGPINANWSILIFKRLWTIDKSSVFSCEVCKENSCCIKSDAFTLDPYYGPYSVDLDVKEKHIYLNENEKYTVKCFANCNPPCRFWWEGYVRSDNEELVIGHFDARKAGKYVCKARNKEADIMAKSDPIYLYLVEDPKQGLMGMGLVIAAVVLVIVGIVILKNTRCYSNVKLGSEIAHQPCAARGNNEARVESHSSMRRNRPLPIPPMQERTKRLNYPKLHCKSKSLQKLTTSKEDLWKPARESLSLQTLIQLSQPISRHSNNDGSVCISSSSKNDIWFDTEESPAGISLVQSSHANHHCITTSAHGSSELESQGDLSRNTDEVACSVYDYARASVHEANLQER